MIKRFWEAITWIKPGSVIVALMLPAVILLTFPGTLIDVFVLFSLIMSLMLLVITLENDKPLKITFLPTIVLLLTTFRLLLSIATTRNILANNDVGNVIETVGQLVMGAGLLSGLIIFVIITIVQFLVVTKGGERVAEVGARFSLDALPGRQMTIDGDLKNNMITPEQAQLLRAELSTENKLFGSLEGAMKFIKGDAIAGILISLVNLFGGIYVGINIFNLSLSESIQRFSILTIGDGLVSQIPSLLLSVACGVYLTRIKGADEPSGSFIAQIARQVGAFWKGLLLIGSVVFLLGVFNLELAAICISISLFCFLLAFFLRKGETQEVIKVVDGEGYGVFESLTFTIKDNNHMKVIDDAITDIEKFLWEQPLGKPGVIVDAKAEHDISVSILNIQLYSFSHNGKTDIENILDDEIFLRSDNIAFNLRVIVEYFLRKRLVEKYNIQFTSNILENLSKKSQVMKKEIDSAIGINRVHDVVKQMIHSPEFYLDSVSFFESLIYWSRIDSDPKNWLMRIRTQARYEITSRLINQNGQIYAALLPSELTELIENFVSGEEDNVELLLSIKQRIREEIHRLTEKYKFKPVIVVGDAEVNFVKSFMLKVISSQIVCSYSDIVDSGLINEPEMINFSLAE